MSLTLRLRGERDGSVCDVAGYTSTELRSCGCEYLRSFLDFDAAMLTLQRPDGADNLTASDDSATILDMSTGSCGASLAASVLHFLIRGHSEAPLEVDGSNAAELLSLGDLWCVDKVKAHVLAALRKSMCNGFRRPVAGTAAVEAVPQVAVLARQALDIGIGDPDGGLQRLYGDCTTWLATWPTRAWPTRTFASLQRPIQNDVLAVAKGLVDMDTAPAALSSCRQLSGIPSVAWARRIDEMRSELTKYTLTYIWSNFFEICVRAGLRRCRSECWDALLEELRNHVTENPDPNAAVRVLPRWASITRALLYGASPAAVAAALARGRGGGGGGGGDGGGGEAPWQTGPLAVATAVALTPGGSWLGEDEASQMQDLYELVRSYCVRHLHLVARCAAFRGLTPAEQQSILLIAQEGICAGLAAGAAATRASTSSVQPSGGPTARNGSSGDRSSAAWVISLTDCQATSSPHSTSRPPGRSKPQTGSGAVGKSRQVSQAVAALPAAAAVRTPQAARRSTGPSLLHASGSSAAAGEGLVAAAAVATVPLARPSATAPPRSLRSTKSAASVASTTSNTKVNSVPPPGDLTLGTSSAGVQNGPSHSCVISEGKGAGGGKGSGPSCRVGQGADGVIPPPTGDGVSPRGSSGDLAVVATTAAVAVAPAATAAARVQNAEAGGVGGPLPAAPDADEAGVAYVAGARAANAVVLECAAGVEEQEGAMVGNTVLPNQLPPADIAVTATAVIRFIVPPPAAADFDTFDADATAGSCYVPAFALSSGSGISRCKSDAVEASCSQWGGVTALSPELAAMLLKPVGDSAFGGTGADGTRLWLPEEEDFEAAGRGDASKEQGGPDVAAADALQDNSVADDDDEAADRSVAQAELVLENKAAATAAAAAAALELLEPTAAAVEVTTSSASCIPESTSLGHESEGRGCGTSAVGGRDCELAAVLSLGANRTEDGAGEEAAAENAELAPEDRSEPGEAGGASSAAPVLPPPPSVSTFVGVVKSSMSLPVPSNLNGRSRGATADGGDTGTASPPSTPMQREAAGAPGNSPKAVDGDGDGIHEGVAESTGATAMAAAMMHCTEAPNSTEGPMTREDVVEVVYAIFDSVAAAAAVFGGVSSVDEWSNRSAIATDSSREGLAVPAAAVQVASPVAEGSVCGRPSLALANGSGAAVKVEVKSKTIGSPAPKRDTAASSKRVEVAAAASEAHGSVRGRGARRGDGMTQGSVPVTKPPARPWVYGTTLRPSPTTATTTTASVTAGPLPVTKGSKTTSRHAMGATPTVASASRAVAFGSRSRTAAAAVGPRPLPAAPALVATPSTAAATATATSRRTAASASNRVSGAPAATSPHGNSAAVKPSPTNETASCTVAVGAQPEARSTEASGAARRPKTVDATTTTRASSARTAPVEVHCNVAKRIKTPPQPQPPLSRAKGLRVAEGAVAITVGPKAEGVAVAAAPVVKGSSTAKRRPVPT